MTVWPKWLYGGPLPSLPPSLSVSWVWGKSRLFSKCMLLLYDPAVGWADYMAGNKWGKLRGAALTLTKQGGPECLSVDSNSQHVPESGETPWRWSNIVLITSNKWALLACNPVKRQIWRLELEFLSLGAQKHKHPMRIRLILTSRRNHFSSAESYFVRLITNIHIIGL